MSDSEPELFTPGEVAEMFRVRRQTVARWARQGLIGSIRTAGGHRRFPRSEVERLRQESPTDPQSNGG